MLTFVTLGPAGTNHEFVTRRYLDVHGLGNAAITLIEDFDEALQLLSSDKADFAIQAAVHPQTAATVSKAFFQFGIYVVDCFISPSLELAVLSRQNVAVPKSIALPPGTDDYLDTTRWETVISEATTMDVYAGLLANKYDSGLTFKHLSDEDPGRFKIDQIIGTVDDPWLVYGKIRTSGGKILAWDQSPVHRLFKAASPPEGYPKVRISDVLWFK